MADINPRKVVLDDAERILVTGAAGHVGANLVHRLVDEGLPVRVLLREGENNASTEGLDVERVYGDLRDPDSLRAAVADCSHVFHVAAKVSTINGDEAHRREIYECNVLGTRNMLEAAREADVERTVVTGSFSAVGYHLDDPSRPADEDVQFYPFHRTMPYERSKVLAEHEVLRAVADGQDVVIATSTACVGPHDYWPSRLGRTIVDFANGKLRAYTDGAFEFVAARDIVDGHIRAMERGRSGHKYIFASEYLSISEMIDRFAKVTGIPKPRLKMPHHGMLAFAEIASFLLTRFAPDFPQRFTPGAIRLLKMRRQADITKARTELGYEPTSILDAIREAYAFHYERGAIDNPDAKVPDFEPEQPVAPAVRAAA